MSKNTKITLGVVAGLLVLCLGACLVGAVGLALFSRNVASGVKSNPASAGTTASEIADFTPPAGFTPDTSLDMMGMKMVTYNGPGKDSVIILIQMPVKGNLSQSTMEQMQSAMEGRLGRRLGDVKTIEQRELTVRGQPANLILQEGTNSDGETYRQLLVAFQGKKGLAMLSVIGPAAAWDQAAYDQMIESIR